MCCAECAWRLDVARLPLMVVSSPQHRQEAMSGG